MSQINCIHCGEDCGKYPVYWDDKAFCCHGCKTVYQILNENKLQQYYKIADMPGIRVEQQDFKGKYAYLDNEEIRDKLIEFSDGEITKVTFYIPSIHCSSCIWLLEHLNTLNPNIIQSMVNFVKKEVTITFNRDKISLRELVELLASIHYIPRITLEDLDRKKSRKTNRELLYKIGIAGFAFGNIMLLSMPHYLPGKELLDEPFRNFFSWISFALSIPVLIYSSNEYLISAFKNLRHGVVNINLPIAIGILAIFIQSSIEISLGIGSGYFDSLTGLVFFLLLGRWYQSKTYQALSFERDYKSYFPVAVTKIKKGKESSTPLKELKQGDHILIRNQELIPADAILIKGQAHIDYSFITGESRPVLKKPGEELFAGGKQIGSAIELEINKEVEQSQLTKLWNQENRQETVGSMLSNLIDRVSKYFTLVVISIAVITAIAWIFMEPSVALRAATAVLIVACPCALALSMPFAFGNTMRLFGKKGFYLKKTEVIERLTQHDTIVFDKTGTITEHGSQEVVFRGKELSDEELIMVKSLARQSTHPLSISIIQNIEFNHHFPVDDFMEIPASGLKASIKGNRLKLGSELFVKGSVKNESKGFSTVHLSFNGSYAGYFEIKNKYREGLYELLNQLKENYELHLISGDNEAEKQRLSGFFDNGSLKFNQSPENKLDYIRKLKSSGKSILMIGDGLNDAGALRESHTGISISDDVYQFSPACDAILDSRNFDQLGKYIKTCHKSMDVVKVSYLISFLYNMIGLAFAVQGLLSPIIAAILMPVSSVSVVAFATFTTSWLFRKMHKKTGKA